MGRYFCVANQAKDKYDYSPRMEHEIMSFNRLFSGVNSFLLFVTGIEFCRLVMWMLCVAVNY